MNHKSIISIPFKGAYYMCIKGSKQAYTLDAANYAYTQGELDLADALHAEALKLPGCAFDARENANVLDSYQSEDKNNADRVAFEDAVFLTHLEGSGIKKKD